MIPFFMAYFLEYTFYDVCFYGYRLWRVVEMIKL